MIAGTAGERRRKPTEIRRAEIADAAMRILATHGARKLTARRVSAEVGITEGAIFRHFPRMDAIVDLVIERMDVLLFEGFPPDAEDPIERLGEFFRRRIRSITSNPHLSGMLLSDHLAQAAGPDRAVRIDLFKQRSRAFVLGCLGEAAAKGLLAPGVSPAVGTVLVLGAILSLAHASKSATERASANTRAAAVWRVLERTLRRPAPSSRRKPPTRRAPGTG